MASALMQVITMVSLRSAHGHLVLVLRALVPGFVLFSFFSRKALKSPILNYAGTTPRFCVSIVALRCWRAAVLTKKAGIRKNY